MPFNGMTLGAAMARGIDARTADLVPDEKTRRAPFAAP
jgi:hypothetical protein